MTIYNGKLPSEYMYLSSLSSKILETECIYLEFFVIIVAPPYKEAKLSL